MVVRREQPADTASIHNVVAAAFEREDEANSSITFELMAIAKFHL
jgi:hypothetical protein